MLYTRPSSDTDISVALNSNCSEAATRRNARISACITVYSTERWNSWANNCDITSHSPDRTTDTGHIGWSGKWPAQRSAE
ncbi:hypothetical protein D3C85_1237660 [compost metagenome]